MIQACPFCKSFVHTEEGKPWVLTLAGATGSGKTSFAFSAIGGALSSKGNGNASYVGLYHTEDAALLSEHRAGMSRPTPVMQRPPYVLSFESNRCVTKRLAYFFDIGGGFYTPKGPETDLQVQYPHTDAVVLTFDPCRSDPIAAATEAYECFIEKYRRINRLDRSKWIKTPLAIVMTHPDIPGPFHDIADSELRGKMVEHGYSNLVNMAEGDFSSVSFFVCEASKEGAACAVVKALCTSTRSDIVAFF